MFFATIGLLVVYIILVVLMIVAGWMIISKSGQPGVAIIVPFWNYIALLQAAGKPWWWLFLFFIPFVNIVILVMMFHGLSTNFGKGAGFTVGLIFLMPIFWMVLGFGGTYVGQKYGEVASQS